MSTYYPWARPLKSVINSDITITVVCHVDAGNTGRHLSKALSCCPNVRAGYINRESTRQEIINAISMADIIWVKGDTPAYIRKDKFTLLSSNGQKKIHGMTDIRTRRGAKLVLSPGGSSFRRPIEGYVKSFGSAPLNMYTDNCNIMAPITPDLNYPELNGIFMPHAINIRAMKKVAPEINGIVIGAYVGQCDSKHVYKNLLPAIDMAKERGVTATLVLTKGVSIPNREFIAKMGGYTVYYDQVNPLGVYGRSGVEAMSSGIPIIASITEKSRRQAYPIKDYGSACLTAHNEQDVCQIIESIAAGDIDVQDLSKRSREYATRVHSYESVANHAMKHVIKAVL